VGLGFATAVPRAGTAARRESGDLPPRLGVMLTQLTPRTRCDPMFWGLARVRAETSSNKWIFARHTGKTWGRREYRVMGSLGKSLRARVAALDRAVTQQTDLPRPAAGQLWLALHPTPRRAVAQNGR
jgi:hypothetical protein